MRKVSAEEVKQAMIAVGITKVDHHDCAGCGVVVLYFREGEDLFFDPRCGCTSLGYVRPCEWQEAADWINMQTNEKAQADIAARFGLSNAVEEAKASEREGEA